MKRLFTLLLVSLVFNANSQVYWNFGTAAGVASPTGVPANVTVSDLTSGNNFGTVAAGLLTTTSASTTYTGASGTYNAGAAAKAVAGTNTVLDVSGTDNAYFEFTITPSAGKAAVISGIQFGSRGTSTGPQNYSIRSSLNSYASEIAGGTMLNTSTWALITPTTFPVIYTTNPITIRIYEYGGIGNAASNTVNWRIDDLTVTLAAITPLILKSFSASLVNGKANLSWLTTNEINVNGFAIERSKDANSFNQLDFVAAKNGSSNNYNYIDGVAATGTTYYRLKITEKDGSYKYSQIVTVNAKQSIKLDVFPNPVSNSLVLSHPKAGDNVVAKIITVDGKTMLTYTVQVGATQSSINVSKLKSGNYVVVFDNDGTRSSLQFIKD